MYGLEESNEELELHPLAENLEDIHWTEDEKAYLTEAIDSGDQDLIVSRIDEMNGDLRPKAIDVDPEIKELLGTKIEDIDNKYLEAPNDFEQVSEITSNLKNMEGTTFEEWKLMTPEERLETMQNIENKVAEIAHRTECNIKVDKLGEGNLGFYDPLSKTITLNSDYMSSSYEDYKTTLETVLHEGRHAYQDYNVNTRLVHPSPGACTNWEQNLRKDPFGIFEEYYGYQDYQTYGFERYRMQPVEADARAFAEDILVKLNR